MIRRFSSAAMRTAASRMAVHAAQLHPALGARWETPPIASELRFAVQRRFRGEAREGLGKSDGSGSPTSVASRAALESLRLAHNVFLASPGEFSLMYALEDSFEAYLDAEGVSHAEKSRRGRQLRRECEALFPPADWKSTRELIDHQEKFGSHPICMCYSGEKTLDEVKVRMLQQTTRYEFVEPHNRSVSKAVWDPIAELHTTAKPVDYAHHKLPVIAGESGSGKTMLALCPPDGVPEMITLYFNGFHSRQLPRAMDELPTRGKETAMENAFVDEVVSHVRDHLLKGRSPPPDGATTLRLNLVFDEMGTRRTELRMLCRLRRNVCEAVRAACNAATVSIMALGTGVNAVGSKVGSDIDTFIVHTLSNDGCVWNNHLDKIRKEAHLSRVSRQLNATTEEIAKLKVVQQLVGNPRAAMLLRDALTRPITNSGDWDAFVLRSCVDRCIMSVAYGYKVLNGLSNLSHDELRMHCADALRYVMCPSTQPSPVEVPELDLVHTYGLLVDLSEVLPGKDPKDPAFTYYTSSDGVNMVRVPKSGRFALSPAIGVMAAVYIGAFRPLAISSSTSGEELELAMAMKVALVLTCVHTVAEAHEAMGFDKAVGYDAADKKSLRREIRVAGECDGEVLVHQCIHRISRPNSRQRKTKANLLSKDGHSEVKTIRDALQQAPEASNSNATAVVAINAQGAPYADVIAVAPGLLWLLQLKDKTKRLTAAEQKAEYDKVQDVAKGTPTGELLKVAGCRQAMFGIVERTPSASADLPGSNRHLCVVSLEAAGALRPLRAPDSSRLRSECGFPTAQLFVV